MTQTPTAAENLRPSGRSSVLAHCLLFGLFFLICFGLGYPILNRYKPREIAGLIDSRSYLSMVEGRYYDPSVEPFHRNRVLVPTVASAILEVVRPLPLGTWNTTHLAMLLASGLFMSGAALLVFALGRAENLSGTTSLLAALLYLCSFNVPNMHLAGMIDSGEAFFFCLLLFLLRKGWWLTAIPVVAMSVLAKNTMLVFSAACLAGWLIASGRKSWNVRNIVSTVLSLVLGWLVLNGIQILTHSGAQPVSPLSGESIKLVFTRGITCFLSSSFIMEFWYLLPLGVWRLGRLSRPLLGGSFAAGFAASAIFVYVAFRSFDQGIARPLFDTIGPVLAISSAIFLADMLGRLGPHSRPAGEPTADERSAGGRSAGDGGHK